MIHEELSGKIIGAGMDVLNELRPGLDEKLYERAMIIELKRRGHSLSIQRAFPVFYRATRSWSNRRCLHDCFEKPTTSLTAIPEKSIAVLPVVMFQRRTGPGVFLRRHLGAELVNLLAKIPQLQVTARTSSFAFKGKEIGVPEIARTLHVAHVLEGSVRKAGNSVRITAQLIKAGTDTHLWSQTYDRKLDDIFAIQDEIAADVVKQLKVTLLGAAPKARTTDPEAYALYLQAVQLGRQWTAEAFQQSDALYRKVLAIDPRYAPAWEGLSSNFMSEVELGLLSTAR